MATLAERLDPCVNWFRVLARTRGRVLWIFPALLLVGYLVALRRGDSVGGFLSRLDQTRADAPLLAEARGLNLGYEKVLADPQASIGKPVAWCINGDTDSTGYVDTRATQAISWTPASDDYKQGRGAHGYCWNVLAVVQGAERGVVKLRIVARL